MVSRTEQRIASRTVDRLTMRSGPAGLVLGRAADGGPAVLRLFRPEPTRVVLIGGLWLARVLVFRALAFGTRVLVRTYDPRRWSGFGEAAAGAADRVTVVGSARTPVLGYIGEPVLHVLDQAGHRSVELAGGDSWQTTLTVAPQLTEVVGEAISAADAAVIQRTWAQQAEFAASLLGVDPAAVAQVENLPDDTAAVLADRVCRIVRLAHTALETRMFGPADRA